MAQPTKKITGKNTTAKKTVKKAKKTDKRLPVSTKPVKKKYQHKQEYGTSKLEERFARDFLDKLNVKYIYQFKAESIGRYYDFYIPSANLLLELDGDWFHSYGLTYEQMNPMQKRNKRVDEQKDHWAVANGIPLIRIWEHDINNHPESVIKMLERELGINKERKILEDNKKKRH